MKTAYFNKIEEWRKWLENNHSKESEIWLVFYKKHTDQISLDYNIAVEEALCYGWIDSIIKRIDCQRYARKFTPRKDWQNWSPLNLKRMKKLIVSERMTPAGSRLFDKSLLEMRSRDNNGKKMCSLFFAAELRNFPLAEENFAKLAPSYQKQYITWVESAKKKETRKRRALEAVELLRKNQKLGMK